MPPLARLAVLLSLFLSALPCSAAQQPWDAFPADGSLLARPGAPGTLVVYGEHAEAVLSSGDRNPQAVAAVAVVPSDQPDTKEGRLFAISHNGYLSPHFFAEEDGFLRHALRWLGGGQEPGRVSFLGGSSPLAATLQELGYEVAPFSLASLPSLQLLIVAGEGPLDAETVAALQGWLADGGQVLAAICPWGWQQIHGGKGWQLSRDLAANQLLAPHGLLFTDGTAGASRDGQFLVDRETCRSLSCQRLLARLEAGEKPAQIASLVPLEAALRALPASDSVLLPRLQPLLPPLDADTAPTPSHPLAARRHPLARLAVVAADRALNAATPEHPLTAPGVGEFPGFDPTISARIQREISFDPAQAGWQSTGCYLVPGEVLRLSLEAGSFAGWKYRIGAHADRLWHKDRWPRWPAISRTGTLDAAAESLRLTSPFGGLLYLEANGATEEPLQLRIDGAMAAPWWREGVTAAGEWQQARLAPAPWAELQGKYLILTLPSTAVRELEDPAALMAWWDRVVEAQYLFAGEEPPARPERFVADVLISAGYMHSGYPIMMHLDVAEPRADGKPAVLVDLPELTTKGNWGCFHELGHNRQQTTWTFSGTGEVTNNLFSLYCGEVMSGIEPWNNSWLQGQKKAGKAYLDAGADFAQWTRKPGVALLCYAQVQHAFGWDPFHQVFRKARALAAAERPRTDAAKRSFWVRELSLACGHDLRAFHQAWGWPLEEALQTDAALAALPEWLPDFDELTAAASR